ncbi:unnamed protein product [Pleuronectes platessa]|uniref:Uncharacterized protein n=1 Tax=Pleuronectes platessa TaxID=8262 RepID=A0A9N7THB1_PLEPL|nr:unnamed protein product [Pleuronectes platessa]
MIVRSSAVVEVAEANVPCFLSAGCHVIGARRISKVDTVTPKNLANKQFIGGSLSFPPCESSFHAGLWQDSESNLQGPIYHTFVQSLKVVLNMKD